MRTRKDQQLRQELVGLVNTTVEAAIRGQIAAATIRGEQVAIGTAMWESMFLRRVSDVVGNLIADHEERWHRSEVAQPGGSGERQILLELLRALDAERGQAEVFVERLIEIMELEANGDLRERLGAVLRRRRQAARE